MKITEYLNLREESIRGRLVQVNIRVFYGFEGCNGIGTQQMLALA